MQPTSAKTSARIVPNQTKWHGKLAARGISGALKTLAFTWRKRIEDNSGLKGTQVRPIIFCLWHNRLALSMVAYHYYVKHEMPSNGLCALVSASKDGGLLSKTLGHFGVEAVRGSSSRRGAQALLELTSWIEKGYHVAITPDGPRGPKYQVQDGLLSLAQVTGAPILPVSTRVNPKIVFKSWDAFQVPAPFAKCELLFGKPILIPKECGDSQREEIREMLRRAMLALGQE